MLMPASWPRPARPLLALRPIPHAFLRQRVWQYIVCYHINSSLFFTELTEAYQRTANLGARECSAALGIVLPPSAGQQIRIGQTARRIWESVRVMMNVATITSVWGDCAGGDEGYRTRPRVTRKVCCLPLCSILSQIKMQRFIYYWSPYWSFLFLMNPITYLKSLP